MKSHKKILLLLLLIFPCVSYAQYSQTVEISSSFNPVGSGARALGMGGAFIAVADDATAASWNPAGLIQLEFPEISFVADGFHRTEDNVFYENPEASGTQTVSDIGVNYLSAAYPFSLWGHHMIVSLNYQKLYDLNRKWDYLKLSDTELLLSEDTVKFRQKGELSALGLACAVEITPRLSLGLTVNIWDDKLTTNKWEETLIQKGTGVFSDERFEAQGRIHEQYALNGINFNVGVLWQATENLTIGAVLKTPFQADLTHEHHYDASVRYPDLPDEYSSYASSAFTEDETIDMPMSYGIGIAYIFSRKFTLSFDMYRTEWDDFMITDANGKEISPITGGDVHDADVDPTHQIRFGAEYLFTGSKYMTSLCGGVFYDPVPAKGGTDDYFGFSIGSGIGIGKFIFNIAYQYRFGNDVGASLIRSQAFHTDVSEHMVYSSVILHF